MQTLRDEVQGPCADPLSLVCVGEITLMDPGRSAVLIVMPFHEEYEGWWHAGAGYVMWCLAPRTLRTTAEGREMT